jgi:hypothetical protein
MRQQIMAKKVKKTKKVVTKPKKQTKQYQPNECPKCGSTDYDVYDEDCSRESFELVDKCSCMECGSTWTQSWGLVFIKIENVEEGEKDEEKDEDCYNNYDEQVRSA